tara:strand:+ start:2887 stop:3087 length:201 start_codon:yes stop_codon:yes gene_type:complete
MTKAVILTEEEATIIRKALYLYLSAGSKEERQEASYWAKDAYKIMTNNEYKNPKTNVIRRLMTEIL